MKAYVKIKRVLLCAVTAILLLAIVLFAGCNNVKSAYDVAVDGGFKGTESEWLQTLKGKSAYEIAVQNGFMGSEADWLQSLKTIDIETVYGFWAADPDNDGKTLDDFIATFLADFADHLIVKDPVEAAVQKALRSVVSIQAKFSDGSYSWGSGVIFELNHDTGEAYIVTNYHVLYNDESREKLSADVSILPYGRGYFGGSPDRSLKAQNLEGSMRKDIAVIKVSANDTLRSPIYLPAEIGDSNDVTVGEKAIAVGNPENEGISATAGIISVDSENISMVALDNAFTAESHRVMRVDAAINPGNSGGGLFNTDGKLIGIVNAKTIDEEIDNIGYAIPVSVAMGIAQTVRDDIRKGGNYIKHIIGIVSVGIGSTAQLDGDRVRIVDEVKIESIEDDMPASRSNLEAGDIFVSAELFSSGMVQKRPKIAIDRTFKLSDYLYYARNNDVVRITVKRNGTIQPPTDITVSSSHYSAI